MVNVEVGKEYFFQTDLQMGVWKGHFRLTMFMPEQGKFDLAKLKPSESTENVHEVSAKATVKEP